MKITTKNTIKLLGIKWDDNEERIKAKFGLFRLGWIKNNNGLSTEDVDKIGDIIQQIINSEEIPIKKKQSVFKKTGNIISKIIVGVVLLGVFVGIAKLIPMILVFLGVIIFDDVSEIIRDIEAIGNIGGFILGAWVVVKIWHKFWPSKNLKRKPSSGKNFFKFKKKYSK